MPPRKHGIHQVSLLGIGIILDDDVLQFRQLIVNMIVMADEHADVVVFVLLTVQKILYIGKDIHILVAHVLAHFLYIDIEELEDKESHFIVHGAIDGLQQFSSDGGKLKIEEIMVGVLQIGNEGLD